MKVSLLGAVLDELKVRLYYRRRRWSIYFLHFHSSTFVFITNIRYLSFLMGIINVIIVHIVILICSLIIFFWIVSLLSLDNRQNLWMKLIIRASFARKIWDLAPNSENQFFKVINSLSYFNHWGGHFILHIFGWDIILSLILQNDINGPWHSEALFF